MSSHAKAAGSTQRQAVRLGRILGGAFATRASSSPVRGSGAPSRRGRLALFSLAAVALTGLVLVASAFGSKEVADYFGTTDFSGNTEIGAEFANPRDIGVNRSGAGPAAQGDLYVVDENNSRIQRFDSEGNFVSAWGTNVLTEPVNEQQTITVEATAGTYKLSFGGAESAAIAHDASAATVDNALDVLPGIEGNSNVVVSGSAAEGYAVNFAGSLAATNVPQLLVADDSQLSGSVSTAHPIQGFGQYELCTVAANCQEGVATGAPNDGNDDKNGSLDSPQSLAVDNDTGNVYVSDRDNRRVNVYNGVGTFIRSFGWDVTASGPGDTGVEYEICEQAEGDICKKGVGSSTPGVGQFHTSTTAGAYGIAVSPADGEASVGTVFLANSGDEHVNTYQLDGTSPGEFGSSTEFGSNQPRNIAVDSRGIVYASNDKNSGEVERYDSENANGEGVGFLEPITAENSAPAGPLLGGSNSGGNAATATSGLAVDPDSDEGGPDVDVLHVLRDPSSNFGENVTRVQQLGPTNEPGLTAPPAAVDDEHGAGAGFSTVQGFGLDEEGERLFVSATNNVVGDASIARVYILEENVAPEATLDPVTAIGAHSATLTGSVNPNGFHATYRFEYVDDAEFTANGFENAQQIPIANTLYTRIGNGTSPVALEHDIPAHLIPGTTYHVRLVAGQVFSPVEVTAGPEMFTTTGSAPTIAGTAATVSTDEAILRGAIVPENEAVTNYHFNWGTSEAYGNSTPVGNLASGNDALAVGEELTSLTPGTIYHYQLVATNGTGTTMGPDQTFTTLAQQPGLGPERGYEIASHYPSGGVPIVPTVSSPSTYDGDRLVFDSVQPLPGSVAPIADHVAGGSWLYGSVRGPEGWTVEQMGVARGNPSSAESLDVSRSFFNSNQGLDPDDQNGTGDVYLRQPDGSYTWLSRDPRIPVGTPQTDGGQAYWATSGLGGSGPEGWRSTSRDGTTVAFKSQRPLLDIGISSSGNGNGDLYKWQNGQLRYVSQRPDGSVPEGGNNGFARISWDGSRVVWGAARDEASFRSQKGDTLYVQIDGAPTVDAVKETGVPVLQGPQPFNVGFNGADKDLTRIFFRSASRLTPDSGAGAHPDEGPETQSPSSDNRDLYVYDVAADKIRDLTPRLDGISDSTVDPATEDAGRVRGVVEVSEDGKRVYFVAPAAYDVAPNPFGQLPAEGANNLYLAELDGIDDPIKLRFVADVGPDPSPPFNNPIWAQGDNLRPSDANPDGSVLSFAVDSNLTGQPTGGLKQMFVYDARRDTLECASCPSDGSLPADEVDRFPLSPTGETYGFRFKSSEALKRWTDTSGRVFFDTVTPLTPDDQNTTDDIYEYRAGEMRLVSGGTGANPSKIENVSVDGSSVFFSSSDALAPQDEEPGVPKIYVAREGGGFPVQPELPPCDANAGACEGPGTSAPEAAGAGSAVFEGPGNPKESSGIPNRCKRHARAARKLVGRAKRLRRTASKSGSSGRATRLRRQARRNARAARKRSTAFKRCRSRARAANTDRRASR